MLSTSTRLLRTLSLLHERRFWTGSGLAEALEITERSVRRDIERLRELGYPIHATSGVGGGYALGSGQDLPPLPLDDDEAVAVAIGLRAAATGAVTGLEAAAVRALGKLEAVLPRRLRLRLSALQQVSVALPEQGPRTGTDGALLAALALACREEERVRFSYQDRFGATSLRRVEPYRLVHSRTRWYLLAYDEDRADWRTFRVDRMGSGPPARGHRFRPRPLPAPDVAAYVAASVEGGDAWRHRVRATLHAPREEVLARYPALAHNLTPLEGGRCRLEITGDDLRWLALYLAHMGLEMEIHEPEALGACFLDLAGHMARLAEMAGPETDGSRSG